MGGWRKTICGGLPGMLLLAPVVAQAQSGWGAAGLAMSGGIWLLLLLALVAAGVGSLLYWRRSSARLHHRSSIPPLLFPAAPASKPRNVRPAVIAAPGPAFGAAGSPLVAPAPAPAFGAAGPSPLAAAPMPAEPAPTKSPDSLVDGQTIRFHQPVDGTLQILPGRLEVVAGADSGHCIRFVRAGGAAEVTFGRSEGPPYRHIQLRAPTVSRQHAQMKFDHAGWSIANLSQTNPVVVNGEELRRAESARPLKDGDRIEMGEIAFVFRDR
jgi:hypothetical protein